MHRSLLSMGGLDPPTQSARVHARKILTAKMRTFILPLSLLFLTHAALAAPNYTGRICAAGAQGSATFNPGAESYFFIVAGTDNAAEGSYGQGLVSVDTANPARAAVA